MKVLHVINSLETGGAEKLLLDTIPLYNKRGIQTDLLVLNGDDFPFLKVLKTMNCCKIYSIGSKAYNPLHVFRLMPFLWKYDIAHVHLFPSQYWIVLAKIFSFSKIKLVVTEHSATNPRINSYFLSLLDRFIYKFYDKVVCITDEVCKIRKEHLRNPKSKLVVIQNGVKLQNVYNARPYERKLISESFEDHDVLLIQIASFNKHKDPETVIKAMQYLPENFKLIFVGNGPFRENCESLSKELKVTSRVYFLGSRTNVPQLLKAADISVLSSKGEGLSLTAIESMASGKPFIASNVSGMAITEGAGILFEKGNAEELAFYIKRLMNEKEFYENTVNACKARAQEFDIEFMIDKHVLLYQEIVKTKDEN
ncbi:glycosyltransferase [Flavobacterium sp. N2038]|uniref:glycosyltransferase n=1 Tax=Flavobacterium sp. N2038 TaxID=2986829 RepID=UPI002224B506|nr:glycosyltransferase [Flavobacterium sp. N2038]